MMERSRGRRINFYVVGCLLSMLVLSEPFRNTDKVLAEEAKTNNVTVETKVKKEEYQNKRGDVRLILSYSYPVLEGKYKGIPAINEAYFKQMTDWFTSQKELIEMIQSEETFEYMNGNEVVFHVTYNKNNLIGILHEGYLFTGGAHGMPYRIPTIYNLETEKGVTASEILGKDEKELKKEVDAAFAKKFAQDPRGYWENAKDIVEKTKLADIGYYLTEDGVVFYLDPYIVAPYAAGFVEVIIS